MCLLPRAKMHQLLAAAAISGAPEWIAKYKTTTHFKWQITSKIYVLELFLKINKFYLNCFYYRKWKNLDFSENLLKNSLSVEGNFPNFLLNNQISTRILIFYFFLQKYCIEGWIGYQCQHLIKPCNNLGCPLVNI